MSQTSPLPPLPDQTNGQANRQAAVVAAIAALLMVTNDPTSLGPRVAALLAPLGVSRRAVQAAVRVATIRPVTTIPASASNARGQTREVEFYYRAAYVVQASIRIHKGLREGKALDQLMVTERTHYQRHLDAQSRRAEQARKTDRLVRDNGTTLGWYAVLDNRTSPECRQAHGKNFEVGRRPAIGYPGAVHPHCRCKPGPPHRTRSTVYGIRYRPRRRAA